MNRRNFLAVFIQTLLGATLVPPLARANHPIDKRRLQFVFAQLK